MRILKKVMEINISLAPADRNNGARKNRKNEDDKYYPWVFLDKGLYKL